MKLALGMLCYQDAFLLPKILPILRPWFDRFIVGFTPGTDGTLDILSQHSPIIENIPKSYDWSDMRNRVITVAEEEGCDAMVMIDSDECMLPSEVCYIGKWKFPGAILFPRYEFVDDFDHFDPSLYPDYQARGFPLQKGFHYEGTTHEQLCLDGKVCSQVEVYTPLIRTSYNLFHYGKVKPKAQVAFKYLNYDRLRNGLEPVPELPEDYPLPETWAPGTKKKFEGPKPL